MTALLKAFDLQVVRWSAAARHAGGGTKYIGDIVVAGMKLADAVVVLLTPDDLGCVQPAFRAETDGPHEYELTGQPRLNVVFEAGLAMAYDRKRVVLVAIGLVREMSDMAGLYIIQMLGDIDSRRALAEALQSVDLAVSTEGEEWRTAGDFRRATVGQAALEVTRPGTGPARILSQDEGEDRVLRRIAEHFSGPGAPLLNAPFEVEGMTARQVAAILRELAAAGHLTGSSAVGLDYPPVITGLTQRGARKAGAPGSGSLVSARPAGDALVTPLAG